MRVRPMLAAVVTIVIMSVVAGSSPGVAAVPDASLASRAEVQRIQRHFDSVLVELGDRQVTLLAAVQRANRTALIETLRAYRDRGRFPRNYDFSDPTPYFIDRKTGVLCAVAHLMEATGRRDLVNRIAARDNNVWVPALAGDYDVGSWLDEQGITLAEAARIQLPYDATPREASPPSVSRSAGYYAGSMAAAGASFASILLRDRRDLPAVNVLGVIAGSGALALAANLPRDRGASPAVGVANLVVGSVALVVSSRSLARKVMNARRAAASGSEAVTPSSEESRIQVAPTVSPSAGAGLSIAVRF